MQPTSDFSDLPAQTDLIALIAGKWLFPFVANAIIQLGVPRTRTELRLPRRARWPGSESVGVNGRVHRHRRRLAAPALHRALPAPPYPPFVGHLRAGPLHCCGGRLRAVALWFIVRKR